MKIDDVGLHARFYCFLSTNCANLLSKRMRKEIIYETYVTTVAAIFY